MQILHQGDNFLLARLPQIEPGITHLMSKSGDRVLLHRVLQTGEVLSQEMNMPLLRSMLAIIDGQAG